MNKWLILVPLAGLAEELGGSETEAVLAARSYSKYFDSTVLIRACTREERKGAPVDRCPNHPGFRTPGAPFDCGCVRCQP